MIAMSGEWAEIRGLGRIMNLKLMKILVNVWGTVNNEQTKRQSPKEVIQSNWWFRSEKGKLPEFDEVEMGGQQASVTPDGL